MRGWRSTFLAVAYLATTVSGLLKQLEVPGLVSVFERGGIPPEMLSLFGAVEFVLALAFLFPRSRPVSAVTLSVLFAFSGYLLWPTGISTVLIFSLLMAPLVLFAGLWKGGPLFGAPAYQGANPLGFSKERR